MALSEEERATVLSMGRNVVSSIALNYRIDHRLSDQAKGELVIRFKTQGVPLFSTLANGIINYQYREQEALELDINCTINEGDQISMTAELDESNEVALSSKLEKYNTTVANVNAVATELLQSMFNGATIDAIKADEVDLFLAYYDALMAKLVEGISGGSMPNDTTQTDSVLLVQKELIIEVLQYYKGEVNFWLENNGKESLEEVVLSRLMEIPDCLPGDEGKMQAVLVNIDEYLEGPEVLLNMVKENDANKEVIEEIVVQLNGKSSPYRSEITQEEWNSLLEMLCPYLVDDEERPELVTIEPITDTQFAAGIDDDKLKITYSIKTTDKYPLQFAKIEIYKNDSTLAYVNSEIIEIGEDKTFEWDGKLNQGNNAGKYIRYDDKEFTIKVLASVASDFSTPFESTTSGRVHKYADEWNDASDDIKARIVIKSAPGVTSKFEYYNLLRPQMVVKIAIENLDESGPLGYLDKNDTTFMFLGREINVHKNYQPIITDIENSIIQNNDFAYYKNKVKTIGSKTIRYMNHSPVVSDHSYGFALDIDYANNPQISKEQNLFLKIVTNTDFWFKNLSVTDMKNASNKFKKNINSASLTSIIEGFNFIKTYSNGEQAIFNTLSIIDGQIKIEGDPIYTDYISIFQRSSYLVNDLWFKGKVTDEILTELREDIPMRCNSNIEKVDILIDKVSRYRNLLDYGYKKAYSMSINFNEEYVYLNNYLSTVKVALEKYKKALNLIINEIEETKEDGYSPASFNISFDCQVVDNFDGSKINDFTIFTDRINEILIHGKMGMTFDSYVDWLNKPATKTGLTHLGNTGFFNIENKLVNYFLDSQKINWGGNWNTIRDWMHFQPIDTYLKFD
ncbi:hypothetical protein GCM10011506_44360 [Marivirga lumbricoides]|uniref:Peptidase M15C domain-containing protein n=1 Tax=Marivirga lumbricoides TaxID=1046115 RepID=A0ABQ1N4M1_9BACT|nr:hypothetical protein GCM10011506_44360 [Marivirga lumbricoides]